MGYTIVQRRQIRRDPLDRGWADDRNAATYRFQEDGEYGQTKSIGCRARPDRPRFWQGLGDEAGVARKDRDRIHFDRIAGARYRAGHWRPAQGPHHRDLRAGKLGQDDADAACHRRSAEGGRNGRVRRRRTCAGPGLCQEAGRRYRRTDRVAARYGRTGAGNRRHTGAVERDRHIGDRFGRRAGAAGGD